MNTVRASCIVKGKVQGVYFRDFTRRRANELGLVGYVRNLPLRMVEAVFEGPRDKVNQAIDALHQGPPASQVKEVRVSWPSPTGEFTDFSIRY